jgi:hypothetical protein
LQVASDSDLVSCRPCADLARLVSAPPCVEAVAGSRDLRPRIPASSTIVYVIVPVPLGASLVHESGNPSAGVVSTNIGLGCRLAVSPLDWEIGSSTGHERFKDCGSVATHVQDRHGKAMQAV